MQVALKSDGSFQLSKRRAVFKIGVIFEIFILSGNELDDSDKLISDNNGSEITSIDFLITEYGIS